MPREEPAEISIAPFFSSARRCCSAALTDLNPMRSAISARVGGKPDTSVSSRINCRISPCRSVSSSICGNIYSMRRIVHLDMDAFYASVEQREFGVRSAMPMARAVRLCPQLQIVRPNFEKYRAVSQQVMAILRDCTPLVEPLSLDEAYLDVTENRWTEPLASTVAKELKKR